MSRRVDADETNIAERERWARIALDTLHRQGRESDEFRRARLNVHVYDMLLRGAGDFPISRRRLADTERISRNKYAEGERLLSAATKRHRAVEPA